MCSIGCVLRAYMKSGATVYILWRGSLSIRNSVVSQKQMREYERLRMQAACPGHDRARATRNAARVRYGKLWCEPGRPRGSTVHATSDPPRPGASHLIGGGPRGPWFCCMSWEHGGQAGSTEQRKFCRMQRRHWATRAGFCVRRWKICKRAGLQSLEGKCVNVRVRRRP